MRLSIQLAISACVLLAADIPVHAGPVFNITYTQAVQNNAQFQSIQTAVNYVTSLYSSLFSENVTLNFTIDQNATTSLTSNSATTQLSNFSQIHDALAADGSNVFLPSTDPTGGTLGGWVINTAEAKALSIFSGSASASDGTMTFNPNQSYTFDPLNQSVPGEYDFVAAVEHEFSELMGRDSQLRFIELEPFDLFRFISPGVRSFSTTAQNVYFSINNGTTNLATFNSDPSGDIMDWNGAVANDPYNALAFQGQGYVLSSADLVSMNAVGWESATPEPSVIISVVLGLGLMAASSRRRLKV